MKIKMEGLDDSRELDIEILDVGLLTVEEAEELPKELYESYNRWWVHPDVNNDSVSLAYADGIGNVFLSDCITRDFSVRPALTFNSEILKVGDKFSFTNPHGDVRLTFTVISENKAFCDISVKEMPYKYCYRIPSSEMWRDGKWRDVGSGKEIPVNELNNYEKSDVYKYLHTDFLKEYQIELVNKEQEEPDIEK